jgi:U6 snRNA-associated Sm-like protein LSm4
MLVELKGGDTYNGRLASIDSWMNMNLVEVICTSADGQSFTKLASAYIRGSAIKYLRLPPALLDEAAVKEAAEADERRQQPRGGGRGGGRGRGRYVVAVFCCRKTVMPCHFSSSHTHPIIIYIPIFITLRSTEEAAVEVVSRDEEVAAEAHEEEAAVVVGEAAVVVVTSRNRLASSNNS